MFGHSCKLLFSSNLVHWFKITKNENFSFRITSCRKNWFKLTIRRGCEIGNKVTNGKDIRQVGTSFEIAYGDNLSNQKSRNPLILQNK